VRRRKFKNWLNKEIQRTPDTVTLATAMLMQTMDLRLAAFGLRMQFTEFYEEKFGETLDEIYNLSCEIRNLKLVTSVADIVMPESERTKLVQRLGELVRKGWTIPISFYSDIIAIDSNFKSNQRLPVFERFYVFRQRA
jgi:prophage DNA circulation protein